MRFSIIIPTFNYGRFVGRAVESALSQPGDDFEVLVVDDGSTDDTADVLRAFGDAVDYQRHENAGAAVARNRGARRARGEWLIFLDADDSLLPGAIEQFRSAVEQHPAARMVVGHHISVSAGGVEREARRQPALAGRLANFRDYLDRRFTIVHGAAAMRRENFESLQYPPGITNGEDIVLFAQTLALHPCATFPHATAKIHAHGGRMRNNLDAIIETGLKTVDALFRADVLPAEAMQYRSLFESRRYLSLARSLYKAGRRTEAKLCYLHALRADWRRTLTFTNAARFLCCALSRRPATRRPLAAPRSAEATIGGISNADSSL